jgi:hypothetical protein
MKVTLYIDKEYYEFAKGQAELFGYFGPEDYLNGMLNLLMLREKDEFETNGPPCWPISHDEDEDDLSPEFEEDPGGGVWKKGDLDDDIPF